MGWIGFGRRRIEEGKKRIRWRGENERNLGVRFFKELGKKQFYLTLGRPPGRPAQTESNLGFSRSTVYGLNFFLLF